LVRLGHVPTVGQTKSSVWIETIAHDEDELDMK
jgi:hypothetical protein